jgi:hypothetical protein
MRTKLFCILFSFAALESVAQVISIVGTGVNGWPPDNVPEITLSTTDNIHYTISELAVTTGEVKFRQDFAWVTNWGGTGFPTGTAYLLGPNIPTVAGTYTVNFNRDTGDYSFVGGVAFPSIGIWGPAVDPINGFGGADVDMVTTDGINYILSAFTFSSGDAKFRQDDSETVNWASPSFPIGTGVQDGSNIEVPGKEWTVTFKRDTGAYEFRFPSVGILGTAVTGWDTDVDMSTSDGVSYQLTYTLGPGAIKFRLDDSWAINWGGDGLTGTAIINGNDIPISGAPSLYSIEFNRDTLGYLISTLLTVPQVRDAPAIVYPNPTRQYWTVNSNNAITEIRVLDVLGKTVVLIHTNTNEATIDASDFVTGIYCAKVYSDSAIQTIKLIKQ